MHISLRILPLLVVLLLMSAPVCSAQPQVAAQAAPSATDMTPDGADEADYGFFADDGPEAMVSDPLQPWNYFWYNFNDYFYQIVMQPLGKGYNAVTPRGLRVGIRNMFHNLLFPVRFVNCILQGKFKGAGVQFSRFVGNTAFGLGGFFDYFDRKPSIVPSYDEDFGQTLATWGVGEGFYVVLPILGPSTLRDSVGKVVDLFADPVSYLNPWPASFVHDPSPFWVMATIRSSKQFNEMSFTLDEYDRFKQAAVEPYSAMRDAYIQNRQVEIGR